MISNLKLNEETKDAESLPPEERPLNDSELREFFAPTINQGPVKEYDEDRPPSLDFWNPTPEQEPLKEFQFDQDDMIKKVSDSEEQTCPACCKSFKSVLKHISKRKSCQSKIGPKEVKNLKLRQTKMYLLR